MTYKGFRGCRPMIRAFKAVPLRFYHDFGVGSWYEGEVRAQEAGFGG